jgi:tRNA pseudouridine55 synthase
VEALEVELVEWYEPGKHNHRWPVEEAEAAERNLAEQVWRVKKQQETGKTLTPEEKEQDDQAIAAHETFKKRFEERQDELIKDSPFKKSRHTKDPKALMSGALGQMPQPVYSNKGSNLVPATPDSKTPPPWTDEGPPACKIRLTVSSGYYVRSFCHDLGTRLGSAAIMAELCRSRQSDFTVGGTNTLDYEDLAKGEEVWGPKVADMLARWNGEPEGNWTGTQENAKPAGDKSPLKKQQQKRSFSTGSESPSQQEKRRRSLSNEASEPPRKAAKLAEGAKSSLEVAAKSDDEKSWNGIED